MTQTALSADAQALLLLASPLAPARDDAAKRFSLREWNDLARLIAASDMRRPGGLPGQSAEALRRQLRVDVSTAERITRLLSRGVDLSLELERLASRGIWVITRADEAYPARWKEKLKERAPVALFGAGEPRCLNSTDAIAIVGSRDVDDAGSAWTREFGERCAREQLVVVSGAARGVDRIAMTSALENGGRAIGVLADSLVQMLRNRELRDYLMSERLTLVSTYHPESRFTAGAAMERNKYIYSLANWSVVVASAAAEGGTWSGAVENLKAGWTPLFIRNGAGVPAGNQQLIANGAHPLRLDEIANRSLRDWLSDTARSTPLERQPLQVREEPAAVETAPRDAFDLVWPALQEYLSQPRTEADVVAAFTLEKSQAKKWLARAVEEARVEKLKGPVRFRAVRRTDTSQPDLFT